MSDLQESLIKALKLHESLKTDASFPSSEKIKESILERKRLCGELRKEKREQRKEKKAAELELAQRIIEIQSTMDGIDTALDMLQNDTSELTDAFWNALHAEKDAGKPHSTSTELNP